MSESKGCDKCDYSIWNMYEGEPAFDDNKQVVHEVTFKRVEEPNYCFNCGMLLGAKDELGMNKEALKENGY